jgi:tetratricopeptide (TPR) repeat protein
MALLRAETETKLATEPDAITLLKDLGYIPLTITQAAAYINVRVPRMTIAKYLEIFRHNEENAAKLLREEFGDLRRDPSVSNAVITTWQISFDQIRKDQPSAAELLSLMGALDAQGIPEFLLLERYEHMLDFEDALAPLIDFSLVTSETGRQVFDMHPLVHLATRTWLTVQGELQKWQLHALRTISENYPNVEFENWKTCEALEPHVQAALKYGYLNEQGRFDTSVILYHSGRYAKECGNYVTARERVQKAVEIEKEILGPDELKTLESLSLLSSIFQCQGLFKKAEELDTKLLKARRRLIGKEHPYTLASMNNLAVTHAEQGRWAKAEKRNTKLIELKKEGTWPRASWYIDIYEQSGINLCRSRTVD